MTEFLTNQDKGIPDAFHFLTPAHDDEVPTTTATATTATDASTPAKGKKATKKVEDFRKAEVAKHPWKNDLPAFDTLAKGAEKLWASDAMKIEDLENAIKVMEEKLRLAHKVLIQAEVYLIARRHAEMQGAA